MGINEDRFRASIANSLHTELVIAAPVDKGELKNSVQTEVREDMVIISMAEHWKYVEFGTKPHIIMPKDKKALSWKKDGVDYIAKLVHHPGTRPQPFVRNTFYHKLNDIVAKAAKHLPPGTEVTVEVEINDASS